MSSNPSANEEEVLYDFQGGPLDGVERRLPRKPEGWEYYVLRPPLKGKPTRDQQGRDNLREFTYVVQYDGDRALMLWQGEK